MSDAIERSPLQWIKAELVRRGYRIEQSTDGKEERVIRPDGSVAVIATNLPTLKSKA